MIYLVMEEDDSEFALYKVGDPKSNDRNNEEKTLRLGKPVFKGTKPKFPEYMSFAAIGSRIYMVGGYSWGDEVGGNSWGYERDVVVSNQVFIYDTSTSKCESAPPLNSGKFMPHLFTLGSKLFALSNKLGGVWGSEEMFSENLPCFEMLDTNNLTRGWSPLPHPPLDSSDEKNGRFAFAAVEIGCGVIFASVGRSGIWAFELDKRVWVCVDASRGLPFPGQAISIPNAPPTLCCGYSLKSRRQYGVFRFSYQSDENNNHEFKVDEFEIDNSYSESKDGNTLSYCGHAPEFFGPGGRLYFVTSGIDNGHRRRYIGEDQYRYVEIKALEICNNVEDPTTSPKKKKARLEISSSSSSSSNETRAINVRDLKLKGLWKRCFYGGVVSHPMSQVIAAFAM